MCQKRRIFALDMTIRHIRNVS